MLVTWELVDPLQSETIKISEEVRKGSLFVRGTVENRKDHFPFASDLLSVTQWVELIHWILLLKA